MIESLDLIQMPPTGSVQMPIKPEDLLQMTFAEAVAMRKADNGSWVASLWLEANRLKEAELSYGKSKDGDIILYAIFICLYNDFIVPEWCREAYVGAYWKIRSFKAGSWDDVFGRPHPKGTHLGAKRELHEKRYRVYWRIREILESEPCTPIDGHLFERVGREFGIGGKTKIADIYYKIKREIEDFSGNS